MTRAHRLAHRILWPALALAVAALFVVALANRPPPQPAAAAQETGK